MKQTAVLLCILLSLASCKKDKDTLSVHRLIDCRVEYLFLRDDIMVPADQESLIAQDARQSAYTYTGDHVTRVDGSMILVPAGTNLNRYLFANNGYDSLVPGDNSVVCYWKSFDNGIIRTYPLNPYIFYTDAQGRLTRVFRTDGFHPGGYELHYVYAGDSIVEQYADGSVRRTFYLSHGNLRKVLTKKHLQGKLFSMHEILFYSYDNGPNPFRNRYYLRGAFFRAFSENNYLEYKVNDYGWLTDSTFGLTAWSRVTMSVGYDADGYPLFGHYE